MIIFNENSASTGTTKCLFMTVWSSILKDARDGKDIVYFLSLLPFVFLFKSNFQMFLECKCRECCCLPSFSLERNAMA